MRWLGNKHASKRERKKHYLAIFPDLKEVARKSGYALAYHGSLTRDFDLIAVPWRPRAVSPVTLARRLHSAATQLDQPIPRPAAFKPHGRVCYTMYIGTYAYIDLSVTPQNPPKSAGRPR